ncbi:hypothetical protein LOK49_LG03G01640 [Camellia lanceoleosa]|uniref:Uncharacterized protein n=1 Tax=Camellia lanceoleosa TaxID=1840588 RepID=A0ACC0I7C7_9ERIC|nr:hypothetical protein LOK49_LG03G01640 [Camellia lanceoleosa]
MDGMSQNHHGLDSISLADSDEISEAVSHWCLIGKILAPKQINKQAVSTIIHGAWKARASFSVSPWNDNLFLFHFDDVEDRRWVLQEAPWSIMGNLMILQPLQKGIPAADMEFKWSPFWVQIHGLPLEKMTKTNGEIIGRRIGRLLRVEAHCEGLLLYRSFLRVRVEIDVTQPLPRGFRLHHGYPDQANTPETWINFKFEKLSDYCFDCGQIGHDRRVCKFVTREVGSTSGYGPELRTRIARSTGLPVEHYRKQVDTLEAKIQPLLNRSKELPPEMATMAAHEIGRVETVGKTTNFSAQGTTPQLAEHAPEDVVEIVGELKATKDKEDILPLSPSFSQFVELGPPKDLVSGPGIGSTKVAEGEVNSFGPQASVGPHYFVTEPQESSLNSALGPQLASHVPSPIGIEELSPSSSPPRLDLKTLVLDECMSTVFNNLSLKRKAYQDVDLDRQTKLLKRTEIQHTPGKAPTSTMTPPRKAHTTRNSTSRGRGKKGEDKGKPVEVSELFDVTVVTDPTFLDGTQGRSVLGCSSLEIADICSQVPSTLIVWIGWFIWKDRNNFVFKHIEIAPFSTLFRARTAKLEFDKAACTDDMPLQPEGGSLRRNIIWQAPNLGTYKINYDVAIKKGSSEASVAILLRDSGGRLIDGLTQSWRVSSSLQGEALACRCACQLAQARNLNMVEIEGDNMTIP